MQLCSMHTVIMLIKENRTSTTEIVGDNSMVIQKIHEEGK